MYPRDYLALFPAFRQSRTVFVAMSFADQFEKRWKEVILPGIQAITQNNKPLDAIRVDQRRISDSTLATRKPSGVLTRPLRYACCVQGAYSRALQWVAGESRR